MKNVYFSELLKSIYDEVNQRNQYTEAVVCKCSSKYVFLRISEISQENTCVGVFFNKAAGLKAFNFVKKRLQHSYFPVTSAKFLRTVAASERMFHNYN